MAALATPSHPRLLPFAGGTAAILPIQCASPGGWGSVEEFLRLSGYASLKATTQASPRPDAAGHIFAAPGSARSSLWTPMAAAAGAAGAEESSNDSTGGAGAGGGTTAAGAALLADCSALLALDTSGFATVPMAQPGLANKQQGLEGHTLVWGAPRARGSLAVFGGGGGAHDATQPLSPLGFPDSALAGTPSYLAVHGLGGGGAPDSAMGAVATSCLQQSPAFQHIMQTLAASRMAQQHPFAAWRPTTPCDPAIVGRSSALPASHHQSPAANGVAGNNNNANTATSTAANDAAADASGAAEAGAKQQQQHASTPATAYHPWLLCSAPMTPAGAGVGAPLSTAAAAMGSGAAGVPAGMSTPAPAVGGAGVPGAASKAGPTASVIMTPPLPARAPLQPGKALGVGLYRLSAGRICKPSQPAGAKPTWPQRVTPFKHVLSMECLESLEHLNRQVMDVDAPHNPPCNNTSLTAPQHHAHHATALPGSVPFNAPAPASATPALQPAGGAGSGADATGHHHQSQQHQHVRGSAGGSKGQGGHARGSSSKHHRRGNAQGSASPAEEPHPFPDSTGAALEQQQQQQQQANDLLFASLHQQLLPFASGACDVQQQQQHILGSVHSVVAGAPPAAAAAVSERPQRRNRKAPNRG